MVTFAVKSEVGVCNLALSACKANPITDLDDRNSTSARECKKHYPVIRDRLLKEYSWNCNTKRIQLGQVEAPLFGFKYAYQIPGEVLRILEVDGHVGDDWEVEGETLLSDRNSPLYVRVLRRETNVAKFDEDLIELLSLELAVAVQPKVAPRRRVGQDVMERIQTRRDKAKSVDASEGRKKMPEQPSHYVAVRSV